jgi:flagellar hook protein FlgE
MALTSFYTALTGLNNNSLSINIIGDNLANMNTIGFKAGKASFGELLAGLQGTSTNGNPISFGLGSTLSGITHMDNQGTLNYTGCSTDAAINGNGFFVVSTGEGQGYTRAGSFEYNSEGGLLSSDGFEILGYMAINGSLDTSNGLGPIEIHKGQLMPARATDSLAFLANLDSRIANNETFAAPAQIYDSLGTGHAVTMEYTKTGAGAWTWTATIPAVDTTGGLETDPPVSIGTGSLTFDTDGRLTAPAANPTLSVTGLASGAADMTVTLRLFDSNNNGFLTNYASESTSNETNQNGNAASVLKDISIDSSGVIIGVAEDGGTAILAQLAMADFPNIEGLLKYKGSTFIALPSAGDPSIGIAGTGGRGSIIGSSLEQSNVDMATEFVSLIAAQRAYQANSRIITTTDELYQEAINIKR